MKNIIKTAIFCLAIGSSLFFTGCEDFLNKNLQKDLTQETFPVSESDALLATNAVYATLRNGNYHFGLFPLTDIMSDDALKGSNPPDQATVIGPYDTYEFTPAGEELGRWWATLYEGIKRANVVLVNLVKEPGIPMDQELKNRYMGEASFLRALFYFDLVRAWGGVPIVTELSPSLTLPRSSKEDVYNRIIIDLNMAIDNLPEKYEPLDLGRATKGAARALLAKVYLFQQNYTGAETYIMEVINSGKYSLEPVFTDANSEAGEHGAESVFEVGALGVEAEPGNQYANVQGVRGTPNRGWGFNRPSMDLRNNVFEDDDPRWSGTIINLGDVIDEIEILGDVSTTPDETLDDEGNVIEVECYNRKVWTPGNTVPTQFGHNRRILRYADVLLMAAEILNENNKPTDALMYLNMVRARAREGNTAILPDITTTNQDELREIILMERRRELALEGHRFWDLVRTGKASEVLGPLGFITGKHELFPIPQTEIDISQGSLTQNPGW